MTSVPHEGELDQSASIYQNATCLESWNPRAGGPVWVGLWCRELAVLLRWGGGGAETWAPSFSRLLML